MKPIERIFDLLDLYKDDYRSKQDAFSSREGDLWRRYSSLDYVHYSDLISLGLLAFGAGKGTKVATIMTNSPEWNFFDMGILQIGAIQVPIYPTISEDNYRYILEDASIEYVIVSNRDIYHRIKNIIPLIPGIKKVFSVGRVTGVDSWKEILSKGRHHPDPGILNRIKADIKPGDLATIIYTSGTTGRPKGVMLSHGNFITNFLSCTRIKRFTTYHRVLSFLPLCHVYERMLNYLYQYYGMSVHYVDSLENVAQCMKEVRPHVFAAVPRVLEKIYTRLVAHGRKLPPVRRVLFFWALRQGHKYEIGRTNGLYYEIKLLLARVLVLRHWRRALGGKVDLIVSGSASLHPRLARVFWASRIPVIEGYGLTETSPVIAVNTFEPGGVRFGTVGRVLPGIEVRIADDGEILCRGPNIMLGYYNRPEKTREVIDPDGWFHTGDIGMLEDGKYLKITDRKKEMFKTSTGKFVAPQVVEQKMKESPFIEHVMVMGENRKYTAALIVPNFEHVRSWCEVKHITYVSRDRAIRTPAVIRRIQQEVTRLNHDLGHTERIKKFRLIADEWSIENGELSPTLKLRRKFIQEKYYREIEETYHSPEPNYLADY